MIGFIGVICGLKSEAAVVSASVDQSKVRIGVSGANAQRAEEIAKRFCDEGASAVLSIGVSGGLDPALKPGDLVIGETVIADDGSVYASDRDLLGALFSSPIYGGGVAPNFIRGDGGGLTSHPPRPHRPLRGHLPRERGRKDEGRSIIVGALFGADEIVDSVQKKSALFHNHGAVAVDMESHGAARAAARAGVPFAAIRAIADPADRALPKAALDAVAPDGSTRVLKTLGAALRDPRQFPELMKLGADSAAATKTLRRDLGLLFGPLFLSLDL
ncbi:hypothetical protein [Hyphococcus sp.]|uniref:phosphorylase family protein n=1 Tax=Hyphococcus sp. TaxID=2038636 RepID=UPI003CCBFFAF